MNNQSINLQSATPESLKTRQVTPILKLVIFGMGNLHLALPIKSVYKVVNHTTVYSNGLKPIGVTHLGESEVTVVDLHQQFFQSSQSNHSPSGNYLVMVKNTIGELYGIPVADSPLVIEVPLSGIRVLPESYRRANTLHLASHVAVIPQEGAPLTVFLLDVDRLLPIFQELAAAQLLLAGVKQKERLG